MQMVGSDDLSWTQPPCGHSKLVSPFALWLVTLWSCEGLAEPPPCPNQPNPSGHDCLSLGGSLGGLPSRNIIKVNNTVSDWRSLVGLFAF